MQETWIPSLSQKDPTSHGETKLMCCNYWAHALQLLKPTASAHALQQEKPPQWETHAPQLESSPWTPQLDKVVRSNEDPAQPNINYFKK